MQTRLAFSVLGLISLSLFVWFVGPVVRVGESTPWVSSDTRLLSISVLALLILVPLAVRWVKNQRNKRHLRAGLSTPNQELNHQSEQLENAFLKALQHLRKTETRQPFWKRKDGLYELPWYILIGPPGSGKTTLIEQSGLKFPFSPKQGKRSIQGTGGTRNCDWWFADQAVFLDTAGRFSTQDSNPETDSYAWQKFLSLLKRTRPKQPINGALLTVSITELAGNANQLERLFSTLRLRLQELSNQLEIRVPVYLLITKCDLLEGFNETFQGLSTQGIKEGWGFTLSAQITDPTEQQAQFRNHFEALRLRITQQLGDRFDQETALHARHKAASLPIELARIEIALNRLMTRVFDQTNHQTGIGLFRGLYLTSGTQHGTLLSRLQQSMQIAPTPAENSNNSRAYFIEHVLTETLFKECHLVGYVRRLALLEAVFKGATAFTFAVALTALCLAWFTSQTHNVHMLDLVAAQASAVNRQASQNPQTNSEFSVQVLQQLNQIRELDPWVQIKPEPASWETSLGLSQFEKIAYAQNQLYADALDKLLLPRINHRLETQLIQSLQDDPRQALERFERYLMFHSPKSNRSESFDAKILQDWNSNGLQHLNKDQKNQALLHLGQALAMPRWRHRPALQEDLIQQARDRLRPLFEGSTSLPRQEIDSTDSRR